MYQICGVPVSKEYILHIVRYVLLKITQHATYGPPPFCNRSGIHSNHFVKDIYDTWNSIIKD